MRPKFFIVSFLSALAASIPAFAADAAPTPTSAPATPRTPVCDLSLTAAPVTLRGTLPSRWVAWKRSDAPPVIVGVYDLPGATPEAEARAQIVVRHLKSDGHTPAQHAESACAKLAQRRGADKAGPTVSPSPDRAECGITDGSAVDGRNVVLQLGTEQLGITALWDRGDTQAARDALRFIDSLRLDAAAASAPASATPARPKARPAAK